MRTKSQGKRHQHHFRSVSRFVLVLFRELFSHLTLREKAITRQANQDYEGGLPALLCIRGFDSPSSQRVSIS